MLFMHSVLTPNHTTLTYKTSQEAPFPESPASSSSSGCFLGGGGAPLDEDFIKANRAAQMRASITSPRTAPAAKATKAPVLSPFQTSSASKPIQQKVFWSKSAAVVPNIGQGNSPGGWPCTIKTFLKIVPGEKQPLFMVCHYFVLFPIRKSARARGQTLTPGAHGPAMIPGYLATWPRKFSWSNEGCALLAMIILSSLLCFSIRKSLPVQSQT